MRRPSQQPVGDVVRALKSLSPALSKKLAAAKSQRDAPERARQIIEAHPELLTDEADALLLLLSEAQAEERIRIAMWAGVKLLRRCRRDGIDAALPA